jgi:hypothetical protein
VYSELELYQPLEPVSQLRISGHGEERDEGALTRRESKGRAQVSKWLTSTNLSLSFDFTTGRDGARRSPTPLFSRPLKLYSKLSPFQRGSFNRLSSSPFLSA